MLSTGHIAKDDFSNVIQALGVYIPDSEIETLKNTLADFEQNNIIKFNPMFAWFQKVTKEADEAEAKDAALNGGKKKDDSDDDDDDE